MWLTRTLVVSGLWVYLSRRLSRISSINLIHPRGSHELFERGLWHNISRFQDLYLPWAEYDDDNVEYMMMVMAISRWMRIEDVDQRALGQNFILPWQPVQNIMLIMLKKIWAMMMVIMSMVVMMVRAMSRGMRMLTTISTSRLKAARFIFARGNLCRIWFPLWLGLGRLLEKPALLFISLTISHHCPPKHFWPEFIANILSVGWKFWVRSQGATEFICSIIPKSFLLYPKSWPVVNS